MNNELDKIKTISEFGKYLEKSRKSVAARRIAEGVCSPEYLRDIERGRKTPSEGILFNLSKKLNIDSKRLIFTLRRVLAPDEIKDYYSYGINNAKKAEHDLEHLKLNKEHDDFKKEFKDIKNMLKNIEQLLKKK